ncbi:hypothetical protein PPTG_19836 [Phytophthora nicotianae INRA-310]|uniref:RxLR effector protein n=1 Tax=Phytophthora nicotianae (strain INRA-310) TaxID=761204 RepID=W2PDG0_PHYN3|nr:hypothetical protein PPTG_19836 [Phytophthora nicotianae INRA-310]ETM98059.1 hypothetical protein PPTG_19836 [Phytophthora nicotianae INRA-310]
MIKLFILAVTVALTTLSGSSTITEDNCVLIDFTAEEAEFEDLNCNGVMTAASGNDDARLEVPKITEDGDSE